MKECTFNETSHYESVEENKFKLELSVTTFIEHKNDISNVVVDSRFELVEYMFIHLLVITNYEDNVIRERDGSLNHSGNYDPHLIESPKLKYVLNNLIHKFEKVLDSSLTKLSAKIKEDIKTHGYYSVKESNDIKKLGKIKSMLYYLYSRTK